MSAAYLLAAILWHDLDVPVEAWPGIRIVVAAAIVVHLGANWTAGLYGRVWAQASVLEARRVLAAGLGAAIVLVATLLLTGPVIAAPQAPWPLVVVGAGASTGLLALLRFHSRLFARRDNHKGGSGRRVLLVGAGESAGILLRELRRDDTPMQPVGLLDDDVRKQGRSLSGVPVLGTVDDLVDAGRTLGVDEVLLAIPSATSSLVRRVADATVDLGASLKVLPRVADLLDGQPQLRDVRDLSIDDLLGREQVATDLAAVAALIRGRRVLVTGGGGSIGAEIARQITRLEPSRLLLVDHDETHLFDAASEADGSEQVLLDIRDRRRVNELFDRVSPDIVFHAAANKHVPLLESYPCEAVATNVHGTHNIVAAAARTGVKRLVFISTDKAVNPSSVMGASKRIGEQLVLRGAPDDAAWCAVRFGNVIGSRGSVVPTFVRQIREGGPVTLTHPDMTRFFMSIPEAVELVMQAAALAEDREVFMLDMGEPVRIMDLATRMISLAGLRVSVDIPIEVTGTRPGEKLAEELTAPDELATATSHPKVMRLQPSLIDGPTLAGLLEELAIAVENNDEAAARHLLFGAVTLPAATVAAATDPHARMPRRADVAATS